MSVYFLVKKREVISLLTKFVTAVHGIGQIIIGWLMAGIKIDFN